MCMATAATHSTCATRLYWNTNSLQPTRRLDPDSVARVLKAKISQDTVNWKNRAKRPEWELSAVHREWMIEKPPLVVLRSITFGSAMVLGDS